MNASMRTQWLEALRSDRYIQGAKVLSRVLSDGRIRHCCLGVLCDLTPTSILPRKVMVDTIHEKVIYYAHDSYRVLAMTVQRVYNLGADFGAAGALYFNGRPLHDRGEAPVCLANLNDDGLTFAEIADLIEWFVPADVEEEAEIL